MPDPSREPMPPPIVALASWLVPGAGYWLIGQRARSLAVGITVVLLFLGGLFIGGLRVVELPGPGDGWFGARLLNQKPWFIGQVLAGPVSLVPVAIKHRVEAAVDGEFKAGRLRSSGGGPEGLAADIAREVNRRLPVSHVRVNEIGTLYCAIAGMLNLMAIIDAAYRAGRTARTAANRA